MSELDRIYHETRNVTKERKIQCGIKNCTNLAEIEYWIPLVGHTFWCQEHRQRS